METDFQKAFKQKSHRSLILESLLMALYNGSLFDDNKFEIILNDLIRLKLKLKKNSL